VLAAVAEQAGPSYDFVPPWESSSEVYLIIDITLNRTLNIVRQTMIKRTGYTVL
jgi:hypothetical protein